jgi:alpha-ketoglutarate-dependent taurine dioxygenase
MTTQAVLDRRAWRADTYDNSAWLYPLPDACLSALDPTVEELRRRPRPVTELSITEAQRSACRAWVRPALELLESAPGFVVIDRVPLERYSPQEATALYWLVGQLLGVPFEQNVQGALLYDVHDTGQDVRYGARFSVTNADSSFHTDNSFGDTVLDYVGLLCLNAARSGGLSQLVSAYAVYDELRARHPDVLETLSRPFHIDRRGGVKPGEAPTARFPIFERRGDGLVVRYLRYWIEAGHEKAGEPLTAEQVRALDTLDAVTARPDLRVEFMLRPGQMFLANNRWTFHNRTAFEDHDEPELRRHYVRLWLRRG